MALASHKPCSASLVTDRRAWPWLVMLVSLIVRVFYNDLFKR